MMSGGRKRGKGRKKEKRENGRWREVKKGIR